MSEVVVAAFVVVVARVAAVDREAVVVRFESSLVVVVIPGLLGSAADALTVVVAELPSDGSFLVGMRVVVVVVVVARAPIVVVTLSVLLLFCRFRLSVVVSSRQRFVVVFSGCSVRWLKQIVQHCFRQMRILFGGRECPFLFSGNL